MVVALVVRWADRGRGQDSGRFVSAGMLLSAGVIALHAWRAELGLFLALLLAALVAALLPLPRQPPSVAATAAADQD